MEVGPTSFDNVHIGLRKPIKGGLQLFYSGEEPFFYSQEATDMEGCREGVITGLGPVDVVIGVEEVLAQNFIGPVGNDFIDIHIALGSRPCLPNHQGEVVIQAAG